MTTPRIPESVVAIFEQAGWTTDRSVPNDIPTTHPAHGVLRAFSGLRVGRTGAGETCAKSDIDFQFLTEPGDDEIWEWAKLLKTTLVGVGEVHHGHSELWVASDGRCFGRGLIHDAFYFEGESFGLAAERLLLGRGRSRPLIHPRQDSVMHYGETHTRDHPDLYIY